MTDQLSLLPMLDDAEHPTWLLNGKPAIKNDCGVYVENVFRFREGKLSGVNVGVDLCAEGDKVHALEELAQCGAVIIRMMDFVSNEIDKEANNG